MKTWMVNALRQFPRDINEARRAFVTSRPALIVTLLTCLPWFVVIVTGRNTNVWQAFAEILGIAFVYWFLTRGKPFEFLHVRHPLIESAIGIIFVLVWMLFRLGQYVDLIQLPAANIGFIQNAQDTVVPKMVEMFLLPLGAVIALRYRPAEFGLRRSLRDWLPAVIVIAAFVALGLSRKSPQELWERTVYFYFGAGLPEEFLFRAFLQTRLEALTKSPVWGLFLASFLFGFSHLPINLSGARPDNWISAFESAFTFQFTIGFVLGFAFQRVRNVLPLTVIHALIDSAP